MSKGAAVGQVARMQYRYLPGPAKNKGRYLRRQKRAEEERQQARERLKAIKQAKQNGH